MSNISLVRKVLCAALAVVSLTAGVAKAAVVTLTFTGTVTTGFDGFNEFDTGSSDLTGQSYFQTLKFDTADLNVIDHTPYRYGAGFDNKPIHASGSVTINGKTISWESDIATAHLLLSTQVVRGGGDEFQMGAEVYISPSEYIQSSMYLNSSLVSFVGNADPGKSHSFNGDLSALSPSGFFGNRVGAQYAFFVGDLSSVSYQVSAVPEPAPFAMFGIGLGMIALVRRRKRSG